MPPIIAIGLDIRAMLMRMVAISTLLLVRSTSTIKPLKKQTIVAEKDELNRSIALPQDSQFWAQLFKDSKKWGMEMYEQDWLDVQYLTMK